MSTAVVVNKDAAVAARHAAALRNAGYMVEMCGGPDHEACPLLGDLPCPLVDRADVLVYDALVVGGGDGARQLITELRDTYPDLPIVLTSVEPGLDWVETAGPHRVTPLPADPSAEALQAAVGAALDDQGMAV